MQNNSVKIIKVRKCFFSSTNKILIQALDDCEAGFSIVDDYNRSLYRKIGRIQKNHMQWVEVPKSFVFFKNQIIHFYVICTEATCDQFSSFSE
jgi:hypothetical protein